MPRGRPRPPRRRAALALGGAVALLTALWLALPALGPLAAAPPRTTALIEQRRAEARRDRRPYTPRLAWVPLERLSPRLVEAVVASEDSGFWGHHGFDWGSLRDAAREGWARGKLGRGGSTITQQLAKNLWLGTERSLWRKAREAVLAAWLEARLPKRRILALYLNVAEWGNGIFGAEAGARAHLGTGAGALTTAQAVLLASMLPAPRRVDLRRPSGWLRFRATHLLDRLRDEGTIGADEHRTAAAELGRLLAGPAGAGDEEPPDDEAEEAAPAPSATAPAGPTGASAAPTSAAPTSAAPTSAAPGEPPAQAPPAAPATDPAAPPASPAPMPAASATPPAPPRPAPAAADGGAPQGAGTAGQADSAPPEQPARPHE